MSSKEKGSDAQKSPETEDVAEDGAPKLETGEIGPVEDAEFVDVGEDQPGETAQDEDAPLQLEDEDLAEPVGENPAVDPLTLADPVEEEDIVAADAETEEDSIDPLADDPAVDGEDPDEDRVAEPLDLTEASEAPSAAPPPPVPPAAPAAAEPQKSSGGGFVPALIGGLVAAGLGFGAATYLGDDSGVEQSLSSQEAQLSALETRIGEIAEAVAGDGGDELAGQFAGLTEQLQTQFGDVAARLDAVAGTIGNVEGQLGASIGAVQEQLSDVDSRLAAVNERLTAVEKRPLQESSEAAQAAFAAYERELEELKATLGEAQSLNDQISADMEARAAAAQTEMDEVAAKAEAMQAEAAAKADAAAAREALASLDGAVARGSGYATPLAVLGGITEVPEVLAANAETGVVSLPVLRQRYPDLARVALDASIRDTVADDTVGRIGAFLRSQTGARSLAPREGDDPDALLSRAEAALDAGDLQTSLSELAQLPPAGQAVMADWVEDAETRLAVTQAAADLAETLLAN